MPDARADRRLRILRAATLGALLTCACGPSRPEPQVVVGEARAELAFVSELGAAFAPLSLEARLDGQPWGRPTDEGGEGRVRTVRFAPRTVPAGEHEVRIRAVYRGEGHGVFAYLKEYRFEVKSTHTFRAPVGRTVALTATCYEKGGPTTPLEDRPQIRWREEVE